MPGMYGGQRAREMAVPGHRQGRPRHPEYEGQQRAQRGEGRAHPDDRGQLGPAGRPDRVGERGRRLRQPLGAQHRQRRHRDRGVHEEGEPQRERHRPRDRPLRIAHLLAQSGDPGVAREGEEQQASALQQSHGAPVRTVQPPRIGRPRGQAHHDHPGQHRQDRRNDQPGDTGRLLNSAVARGGQRHHRRDGHGMLLPGPEVRTHGEGHRRTGRGLADHESPAGQIPPERAEPLAPVDVRAAGGRVPGGEPRRGVRVAVGHERRQGQSGEERAARRARRRGERGEDAGADHRAESDDDGVGHPQGALQLVFHGRRVAELDDALPAGEGCPGALPPLQSGQTGVVEVAQPAQVEPHRLPVR